MRPGTCFGHGSICKGDTSRRLTSAPAWTRAHVLLLEAFRFQAWTGPGLPAGCWQTPSHVAALPQPGTSPPLGAGLPGLQWTSARLSPAQTAGPDCYRYSWFPSARTAQPLLPYSQGPFRIRFQIANIIGSKSEDLSGSQVEFTFSP